MTICLGGPASGFPAENDLSALLQAVEQAANTSEAHDQYEKIFASIDDETLDSLVHHKSKSISLRAAWERTQTHLFKNPPVNRAGKQFVLGQFCGLTEARAGCVVPEWWETAVKEVEVRDGYFRFPRVKIDHQLGGGLAVFGVHAKNCGNGRIQIRAKRDPSILYDIPEEILHDGFGGHAISATFDGANLFFASAAEWSFAYRIRAIELPSGKIKWTNLVWGSQSVGGATGSFTGHRFSIIPTTDHVVIFGRDELHIYVEAFDRKDGSVVFRFCNSI